MPHRAHRDGEHLAGFGGHGADERGLPFEQAELTQEPVRPVHPDDLRVVPGSFGDGDLAAQDHEELGRAAALRVQHLTRLDRTAFTAAAEGADLLVGEPGERSVRVRGLGQRPAEVDPRQGGHTNV